MDDDAERERKRLMRWQRKCPHSLSPACIIPGCFQPPPALMEYRWVELSQRIRRKLVQGHHVARKTADPDTIVVLCRNHHAILDDAQYDWPIRLQNPKSRQERIAALLAGIEDMLRLLAEAFVALANRLREIWNELLGPDRLDEFPA